MLDDQLGDTGAMMAMPVNAPLFAAVMRMLRMIEQICSHIGVSTHSFGCRQRMRFFARAFEHVECWRKQRSNKHQGDEDATEFPQMSS